MPHKDEVVAILESGFSHNRKQNLLRRMYGGQIYRYLVKNHFPFLRYSSYSFFFSPELPVKRDTTAHMMGPVVSDTAVLAEVKKDTLPLAVRPERWRLTTNLLYWAALAHNAGLEYALNAHSYLSLRGGCAWWRKLSDNKAYRWIIGELAYMYSFNSDYYHRGWQLGGYVQTGEFELMNGPKNRKGEFTAGGLAVGYRWKIKEHSSLHAELGLGYMYIDYRYAVPMDGRLIYQGRNYVHYWGPTRVSLSWIWHL